MYQIILNHSIVKYLIEVILNKDEFLYFICLNFLLKILIQKGSSKIFQFYKNLIIIFNHFDYNHCVSLVIF